MKRHLTKRDREFIDWVSFTLIPDYEVVSSPVAEDFKLLVQAAHQLDTDSVPADRMYDVQKFLDYVGYTLIPDLKKVDVIGQRRGPGTVKDLQHMMRIVAGFLPDYDE